MMERIGRIHRAEACIEKYASCYHKLEADCPVGFKMLMLVNGWHSPFVAINELLKVIYTEEALIKKDGFKFRDLGYKSRYRELERLVQKYVNER